LFCASIHQKGGRKPASFGALISLFRTRQ